MKSRNYFLILILALLLIGIAYIRALFSHQDTVEENPPSHVKAEAILTDDYIMKEDAFKAMDSVRHFCADSIWRLYSDSLAQIQKDSGPDVDSLHQVIKRFENKLTIANKNIKELERSKNRQLDKLVYRFYSSEIAQLPSDLSDYERTVSVKEIKTKAQKYFSVSSKTLSRILKQK